MFLALILAESMREMSVREKAQAIGRESWKSGLPERARGIHVRGFHPLRSRTSVGSHISWTSAFGAADNAVSLRTCARIEWQHRAGTMEAKSINSGERGNTRVRSARVRRTRARSGRVVRIVRVCDTLGAPEIMGTLMSNFLANLSFDYNARYTWTLVTEYLMSKIEIKN